MNHFPLDASFADYRAISGIDEAGRGCLAGPVVVARVTWRPETVATMGWFTQLADSKTLDAAVRERLYEEIVRDADVVRVAVVGVPLIDHLNILRATLHGFELVAPGPNEEIPLVIDGNQKPPSLKWAATVVKGDSRISAIAAAGILAKVTRDRLMIAQHARFPQYGFSQHKGYATAMHRKKLTKHGACPLHRKTFSPVSALARASQTLDDQLLTFPSDPVRIHQHWRFFTSHYHVFSPEACREALMRFHLAGLKVLPNPGDRQPAAV